VSRFDVFWSTADVWQRAAFIAIMVAAIAQTGFVGLYVTRPWWRHYVGRALLVKSASLLVVLWLTIVNTFLRYRGQEQISTLALWLIAGAIIYQLVALARTRRDAYPPNDQYDTAN
jgi:putative copper export protein